MYRLIDWLIWRTFIANFDLIRAQYLFYKVTNSLFLNADKAKWTKTEYIILWGNLYTVN